MPPRFSRAAPWLVLLLVTVLALAGAWSITLAIDLPSGHDFNLAGWEVRHLGGKWLYQVGRLFRGDLSEQEKDAAVARFLTLNARVAELEHRLAQPRASAADTSATQAALRQRRRERDALENDVEAILEERLSRVASDAGLESSLPLFPGLTWLFPPVDTEFDAPPRVLVLSPRDRILLESQRPLRQDLTLKEILRLEEEQEARGLSALVVQTGGAATYPSAVQPTADYRYTLEMIAHEWLHHYLFFKPLGRRYFQSEELTTLNETVADMAGRELAALVAERYPLKLNTHPQEETEPSDSLDLGRELRSLRLKVERLLEQRRVEEAEALMEERRRFLEAHGLYIRKINQAYFAFYGVYADTPASISPIGPKLAELRRRSPSLGEFIRTAALLTSEEDLDRLLAQEASALTQP